MRRAYALYFDGPQRDWARGIKRTVAAAILALHLLLLAWLLRDVPPRAPEQALIVVELNAPARAIQVERKKSGAPPPAAAAHATAAQRTTAPSVPVEDGQLAPSTGPDGVQHSARGADSNGTEQDGSRSRGGGQGASSGRGHFRAPRVVHRWASPYPSEARKTHAEGDCDVLVTIGADGTLIDARVERSSGHAELDAATLEAIRRYVFSPGEQDGTPILAQAIVGIEWHIRPSEKIELSYTLPGEERDLAVSRTKRMLEDLHGAPRTVGEDRPGH